MLKIILLVSGTTGIQTLIQRKPDGALSLYFSELELTGQGERALCMKEMHGQKNGSTFPKCLT